jgi:hypothetical protein
MNLNNAHEIRTTQNNTDLTFVIEAIERQRGKADSRAAEHELVLDQPSPPFRLTPMCVAQARIKCWSDTESTYKQLSTRFVPLKQILSHLHSLVSSKLSSKASDVKMSRDCWPVCESADGERPTLSVNNFNDSSMGKLKRYRLFVLFLREITVKEWIINRLLVTFARVFALLCLQLPYHAHKIGFKHFVVSSDVCQPANGCVCKLKTRKMVRWVMFR